MDQANCCDTGDAGQQIEVCKRNTLMQGETLDDDATYAMLAVEARPLYTYPNGSTYKGEWLGNYRHGEGIKIWPIGDRYDGEWKADQAHGNGRYEFHDGHVYEGEWREDKLHGEGVYTWPDGAQYVGQYANGIKAGKGEWKLPSGECYSGEWREDKLHGEGVHTRPDGAQYVGQYANGIKAGKGEWKLPSGECYSGEFDFNVFHGEGVYALSDRKYEGQFFKNKRHGKGVCTWSDGRNYNGEYSNDRVHGHGVLTFPDGRSYDCQWVDSKPHGTGTFCNSKGEKKRCKWEVGKRFSIKWPDQWTCSGVTCLIHRIINWYSAAVRSHFGSSSFGSNRFRKRSLRRVARICCFEFDIMGTTCCAEASPPDVERVNQTQGDEKLETQAPIESVPASGVEKSGDKSLFTVILQRDSETDALGIDVNHSDRITLKVEVVSGGLVAKWNASQPEALQLKKGDRIMKVNDIQNDSEAMIKACKMKGEIVMKVQRE